MYSPSTLSTDAKEEVVEAELEEVEELVELDASNLDEAEELLEEYENNE